MAQALFFLRPEAVSRPRPRLADCRRKPLPLPKPGPRLLVRLGPARRGRAKSADRHKVGEHPPHLLPHRWRQTFPVDPVWGRALANFRLSQRRNHCRRRQLPKSRLSHRPPGPPEPLCPVEQLRRRQLVLAGEPCQRQCRQDRRRFPGPFPRLEHLRRRCRHRQAKTDPGRPARVSPLEPGRPPESRTGKPMPDRRGPVRLRPLAVRAVNRPGKAGWQRRGRLQMPIRTHGLAALPLRRPPAPGNPLRRHRPRKSLRSCASLLPTSNPVWPACSPRSAPCRRRNLRQRCPCQTPFKRPCSRSSVSGSMAGGSR